MFVRPAFWPTVRALAWELRWDIAGTVVVAVVMSLAALTGVTRMAPWAATHGQSTAPSECICR